VKLLNDLSETEDKKLYDRRFGLLEQLGVVKVFNLLCDFDYELLSELFGVLLKISK
jgi:hypothetical protein